MSDAHIKFLFVIKIQVLIICFAYFSILVMLIVLLYSLLISSPAIVRTLPSEEFFQETVVDNLDISNISSKVGRMQVMECGIACMSQGDTCSAFHRSSEGDCFLLRGVVMGWPEKVAAPPLSLWMRTSKMNPSCSATSFPLLRGRSRYGFQSSALMWLAAYSACRASNAKLAEIMSTEERLFLVSFVNNMSVSTTIIHLGFIKKAIDRWIWITTGEEIDQPWDTGQPDGSQLYGAMNRNNAGKFHDIISNIVYSKNSICECMLM